MIKLTEYLSREMADALVVLPGIGSEPFIHRSRALAREEAGGDELDRYAIKSGQLVECRRCAIAPAAQRIEEVGNVRLGLSLLSRAPASKPHVR